MAEHEQMERSLALVERVNLAVSQQVAPILAELDAARETIREQAEEEARRILRDAEDQSRVIVQRLRDEAREIEGQIESLLVRRREVETSIEALIASMSKQLEHVRQQHADDAAGHLAKTG